MTRRLALLLVPLTLAACTSRDHHEFHSTVQLPTTVTLKDPYSDTVYWSKDVPVGYRFVIDLQRQGDIDFIREKNKPAQTFHWMMKKSGGFLESQYYLPPEDSGDGDLPGTPVLLKVSYRPAPEYPPGYTPPASAHKPVTPGSGGLASATPPSAVAPTPVVTPPVRATPETPSPLPPTPMTAATEPAAPGVSTPAEPARPMAPASRPSDLLDLIPPEPAK